MLLVLYWTDKNMLLCTTNAFLSGDSRIRLEQEGSNSMLLYTACHSDPSSVPGLLVV